MCSKRCAKPVRPGFSFFEPTWNHWLTWTIGSLRSTCRISCRPFGSMYFSNSIFGAAGAADAAGRGAGRGWDAGLVTGAGWLAGAADTGFAGAGRGASTPWAETSVNAPSAHAAAAAMAAPAERV